MRNVLRKSFHLTGILCKLNMDWPGSISLLNDIGGFPFSSLTSERVNEERRGGGGGWIVDKSKHLEKDEFGMMNKA